MWKVKGKASSDLWRWSSGAEKKKQLTIWVCLKEMGREDMKGLSLPLNIKCYDRLTEAWRSVWNRSWVNMVGLCGGFGASLATVIMRSHSCALTVQCCRLMTLAPFIPLPFNYYPIWSLLFLLPQQWRENSLLRTSKPVWTLKNPPYSNRSSKDSGYSDCQLGVPTRPIRSQRKIDVSKGDTEESAVLWRVLKDFMPLATMPLYLCLWR